jgi:hypothetical protein
MNACAKLTSHSHSLESFRGAIAPAFRHIASLFLLRAERVEGSGIGEGDLPV